IGVAKTTGSSSAATVSGWEKACRSRHEASWVNLPHMTIKLAADAPLFKRARRSPCERRAECALSASAPAPTVRPDNHDGRRAMDRRSLLTAGAFGALVAAAKAGAPDETGRPATDDSGIAITHVYASEDGESHLETVTVRGGFE